jgi:RNA polymerase sigma factor for flagellar operon FliA
MSDVREETIRAYWPMVKAIARRLSALLPAAELDDVVGDGAIGLIRAVDAFDPSRNVPLRLYVRRMILCSMLNGIRSRDPVPERARRILREAERQRFALAQQRGSLPSQVEMERHTARLAGARRAAHAAPSLSLDGPLRHTEGGLLDRGSDPADYAVLRDRHREVREAIALLPERERRVVALHYYARLPLAAISSRLRVSPQRASQIHLSALQRLRLALPAP